MKLIIKLSILLLLCLPISVMAELPKQLKADFAPLTGFIIMPVGDEYLIDLDASSNLQEGDILTLVAPGEKVIHPVTKEVLGTLDIAKGYLQVTRLKSGYSYAKLLSLGIAPAKGDQIKRFEQVPATFTTESGDHRLYDELKSGLPQLTWLEAGSSTQPVLIFSLANNTLTVKDAAGTALRAYQYVNGELIASLATGYRPDPFNVNAADEKNKSLLNKTVDNLLGGIGFGGKDERLEGSGIIQNNLQNSGTWMGPNLSGNPVGIAVADFDGDGKQETVVAMETHLLITAIAQGKLTQLAKVEFAAGTKLLSIDAIDLNGNGTPEIYLSAASGKKLNSQVVEYQNGTYQRTMGEIPWFLRVVELPSEGRTLLAQKMGNHEAPFNGPTFRVIRVAGELTQGQELPLPENSNLFSFLPFVSTDNHQLFAYISTGDYLHVTSQQGTKLWESSDYFGGTEVSFYNAENQEKQMVNPIFIQQRLLKTPAGEILAAQNMGFRFLQRFRNFKKSRIVALSWNGFALQESWRTGGQNGYLADFALADADNDEVDELVLVMKYQQKNIVQKGRSTVVIYELSQ